MSEEEIIIIITPPPGGGQQDSAEPRVRMYGQDASIAVLLMAQRAIRQRLHDIGQRVDEE